MSRIADIPRVVSRGEEQAWNWRRLATPVKRPAMRLWIYRNPAVVLGRSQRGLLSSEEANQRAGVDFIERQAGGGAVLVGPWMLSASVALPLSHPLVARGATISYRWIGDTYASVLRELGIAACALPPEEVTQARRTDDHSLDWACFGGLAPWEVVVGGRKILGLAQVRRHTGVLLVAGLLLDRPDWPLLCRAMGKPAGDADTLMQRTTYCAAEFGRLLPLLEVAYPLSRALQEAIECSRQELDSGSYNVAEALG